MLSAINLNGILMDTDGNVQKMTQSKTYLPKKILEMGEIRKQ